jgi:AhpD family alkylhydroperoxidase
MSLSPRLARLLGVNQFKETKMSSTTSAKPNAAVAMPTAPDINPYAAGWDLIQPYIAFAQSIGQGGLEPSLNELVKIRASQLNGCAVCLDMHVREARQQGESEPRIYMLSAWRESTLYSPRERAALAWTEALTRLDNHEELAATRREAAQHFAERELVLLALMIMVINGFNRLGAGFGLSPAAPAAEAAQAQAA